jgi:DNA-binding response OmpR family regulator
MNPADLGQHTVSNELIVEPPSPPRTLRVVVVDPRVERRTLIRFMLETGETNASVVGEAGARGEAVTMLDQIEVDAVVLEIQMPVEEGLRTIADLRMRAPRVAIIVCTFLDDAQTRVLAEGAGADGYMKKPVNARELTGALNELTRDKRVNS